MNTIKKKILDEFKLEIDRPEIGFRLILKSVDKVINFLEAEKSVWQKENLNSAIQSKYIRIYEELLNILNELKESYNNNSIEDIKKTLDNVKPKLDILFNPTAIIFISAPGKKLTELMNKNKNAVKFILSFVLKSDYWAPNSWEILYGYLAAYDLFYKTEPSIKSKNNEFDELITKARQTEIDISANYLAHQNELNEWKENFENTQNEWIGKKYDEYTKYVEAKDNELFTVKDARDKELTSLKKAYEEHLKLEAPVKYWQDRSTKYKKQGGWWLVGLVLSIVLIVGILIVVLYDTPGVFGYNIFKGEPQAIKGLVVFALIITFLSFLVSVFSRLTFSSYHLQRDSEEREQLTLVYLALIKEGKLDEKDRAFVLQSLFSRVDTGLLKGDSSPSMPSVSTILEQIYKK